MGPASAPLTLVEFADFQCPYCAKAHRALTALRRRMGDDLRIVFRHLPLTQLHEHALGAALAAEAAGRQGRFWEMHDLLFAHQDELEQEDLLRFAQRCGLDLDRFAEDLGSEELLAHIQEDISSAEASGVRGTPSFFVNGERYEGDYDAATFAQALDEYR